MNFLISLIAAILLVAIGRNFIKKHANICYILTTVLSVALVVGSYTGVIWTMPAWFTTTILPILIKSTFSTAIFVIVMYTGAFKNGSKLIKFLMPIRAELSIIAGILTLAHNISFGKTHFVNLFNAPELMSTNMRAAAGVSIVLIAIMVPLLVTSFRPVRKLMKPKMWKNLQRFAYLFYALIYVHVMLIMVPVALSGDTTYIINVLVYSVVFITYAVMRIAKHFAKKSSAKSKKTASISIAN
ncbi:MAG: hypothetical protein E6371_10785 [Terrisporobacter othiniensis]|uniref:Ferric oxidoreductase domain-containing protein n=1 Tax=Terrisporobacter othiniensis TaxID=1577792 RepID=A0A0B3WP13_9FIRM|nr:hypothetical protein [Terrisporobacter othiniensis]KHS56230.1 hypothetical protein QX51_14895 [Terrisporobacter othiniensis]MDU6984890.1 hypothetical protein [Terrisporobacter othiniensis]